MLCIYVRKLANWLAYDLFSSLYTYICCSVNILSFGNERIDDSHVALLELWRENLTTIRQTFLVLWSLFDMQVAWMNSSIREQIKIIQYQN